MHECAWRDLDEVKPLDYNDKKAGVHTLSNILKNDTFTLWGS